MLTSEKVLLKVSMSPTFFFEARKIKLTARIIKEPKLFTLVK